MYADVVAKSCTLLLPSSSPFTYYTASFLDGDTAPSASSPSCSLCSHLSYSRHHSSDEPEGGRWFVHEEVKWRWFIFLPCDSTVGEFEYCEVTLDAHIQVENALLSLVISGARSDCHLVHMPQMVGAMKCARRASPCTCSGSCL